MIPTGKCPKCEKVINRVEVEEIDVTVGFQSRWKGASFLCPHCETVLSVGIDPLALKADIVSQVLAGLRKAR